MESLKSSLSLTKEEEAECWKLHTKMQDKAARCTLIEFYLPYAKRISVHLFSTRPGNELEFDDYMQYAATGLIQAVDSFKPDQGAAFTTFANYRIRGAVLNGIESTNERMAQLSFRRRVEKERLESIASGAREEGSLDSFEQLVEVSVGLALGYMLEDAGLYLPDDAQCSGEQHYTYVEIKRLQVQLDAILDTLSDKERQIIRYHYYRSINFNAIADILNLSTGRVSQLHSKALKSIRNTLNNIREFDVTY